MRDTVTLSLELYDDLKRTQKEKVELERKDFIAIGYDSGFLVLAKKESINRDKTLQIVSNERDNLLKENHELRIKIERNEKPWYKKIFS